MLARPEQTLPGLGVLVWGWAAVASGQFGWLANLTLPVVALLTLAKNRPAVLRLLFAGLQIGLAANASTWTWIWDDSAVTRVEGFGVGYYVWFAAVLGSAIALLIFAVMDATTRNRQRTA